MGVKFKVGQSFYGGVKFIWDWLNDPIPLDAYFFDGCGFSFFILLDILFYCIIVNLLHKIKYLK